MFFVKRKNSEVLDLIRYLGDFTNSKSIFLITFLLIFSSITEFLTLFAITGFLGLLTLEPSDFNQVPILRFFENNLGFENLSISNISIFLALIIIVSSLVRILTFRKTTYLAALIGNKVSKDYLSSFLNQKFDSYLDSSEADVVNVTTNYANSLVMLINRFIFLVSGITSSILIILGIFFINARIAYFLIFALPFIYYLLTYRSRKKITFNGKLIAKKTPLHVSIVKDVFGSFRDIILSGSIKDYIEDYSKIDKDIRYSRANTLTLTALPRYIIEPLFILMLTFYIVINSKNNNNDSLYLILGTLVFAALKLIPSLQQIFSAYAGIKTDYPSALNLVKGSLKLDNQKRNIVFNQKLTKAKAPKSFELKSITYSYPLTNFKCLQNINFSINKGEFVGIYGKSGSGKSTFVDIVLTLLQSDSGTYLVNNKKYVQQKEIIKNWVNFVAHVPQRVYLIDSNIENNILFGIEKNENNFKKLDFVSKIALIDGMIPNEKSLREYYVGCNGAKLSGGQRQRVAIARALITGKPILILDEATSALDPQSEITIFKNIRESFKDITIISVTHSKQLLKLCDKIYSLKDGKLILNKK